MKNEMTFAELITELDKIGFDKGLEKLESLHRLLEEQQAFLFAGDYYEVKQAQKMTPMLTKQTLTLLKLRTLQQQRQKTP